MDPYSITQDTDENTVITHPSGIQQTVSPEYMARMESERRAIRQGFIDNNPCEYNCPKRRPYFCCQTCEASKGHFETDELDQFTKEQRETIAAAWAPRAGYLGPDGCKVPRYLRSINCLNFVCQET